MISWFQPFAFNFNMYRYTLVSIPGAGMVTLDCGSKSLAAEAGDPAVRTYPMLTLAHFMCLT